jgi:hypothetical protein
MSMNAVDKLIYPKQSSVAQPCVRPFSIKWIKARTNQGSSKIMSDLKGLRSDYCLARCNRIQSRWDARALKRTTPNSIVAASAIGRI